jgi:hypothetical protein
MIDKPSNFKFFGSKKICYGDLDLRPMLVKICYGDLDLRPMLVKICYGHLGLRQMLVKICYGHLDLRLMLVNIYYGHLGMRQMNIGFDNNYIIYMNKENELPVFEIAISDCIYSQTCPCNHLYSAVTCAKRSPFSCPVI